MSAELFAVGLNHKGAPVELREQLAVDDGDHARVLEAVQRSAGLHEAMVVSTCNRVEVYGVGNGAQVGPHVIEALARARAVEPEQLAPHCFCRTQSDAARHVFRVASSLESLVVGEPQILGQVKTSLSRAREHGSVGPVLDRCLSSAFHCAKRVRTETEIARGGASVPSVAVELARSIFGELHDCAVAIIGAGEMAEQAALHMRAADVADLVVVNRSADRGQALAARVDGRYEPWDRLDAQLAIADIVVSSTAAPQPILDRARLRPITKSRRHRPLFLVDIAVPRDVHPDVSKLRDVFVYNVDDLQAIVSENLRNRKGEADRADALVDGEVRAFAAWLRSRSVGPLMGSLQRHGRALAEAEVARMLPKLGELSPQQRAQVEQLGRQIVQKLLHTPIVNVRRATGAGVDGFDGVALAEALRVLFELDDAGAPKAVPSADPESLDDSTDGRRSA